MYDLSSTGMGGLTAPSPCRETDPRGFKRLPAGATILLGAGMALGAITNMIPHRESTYFLLGCLHPVVLCLMIAGFVAWTRQKPVILDSGDRKPNPLPTETAEPGADGEGEGRFNARVATERPTRGK